MTEVVNNFYMFVGLPGSGKSTFRKICMPNEHLIKYLSSDDYIESKAVEEGKSYKEVFETYIKPAIKNLNVEYDNAIQHSMDIVYDQVNLTPKIRKKKIARLPSSYKKTAIYFHIDNEELLRVNNERKKSGRDIPELVLSNMSTKLVVPTKEEGFDEVLVVMRHSDFKTLTKSK